MNRKLSPRWYKLNKFHKPDLSGHFLGSKSQITKIKAPVKTITKWWLHKCPWNLGVGVSHLVLSASPGVFVLFVNNEASTLTKIPTYHQNQKTQRGTDYNFILKTQSMSKESQCMILLGLHPRFWSLCLLQSLTTHSVQFNSVAQSCPTLCDPMNPSTPGFPVHHQLSEFTQTQVHWVSDAIQPSHPRWSPFPPAPNPSQHQSLFQWVSSLNEAAKVLEFQL